MGETTNEIEGHIRKTREDLGENLYVLEQRAKEVMDWRYHFENHSLLFVSVAFGAGVLAAALFGGSRRRNEAWQQISPPRVNTTWDHVKGALIGVAATKITEFVSEIIPGFAQEYRRAQSRG